MKLFLGTTNPYKVREFAAILSATGCEIEVTDPLDPEETEPDFMGNARLKARVYAAHTGGTTICEDSGLIVPALHGLPGPWSARFSEYGEIDVKNGTMKNYLASQLPREELDRRNLERVIELCRHLEQPHRAASFKVALVVADAAGTILFERSAESHGWLADEPRGAEGFGYDAIFIGQETFGKTYAELDSMRKNLRSHRRRVVQEFKMWLGEELKRGAP
jgi:XTP/dITP diphosphohydrolase